MALYTLEIFRTPSRACLPSKGTPFGDVLLDGETVKINRPVMRVLPKIFGFRVRMQDGEEATSVSGIGSICSLDSFPFWAVGALIDDEYKQAISTFKALQAKDALRSSIMTLAVRDISPDQADGKGLSKDLDKVFYHLASRLPDLILQPEIVEAGSR